MRRHLIVAALALAACSRAEQPADTTAAAAPPPPPAPAITAADVAGTWELKSMLMDKDTVVAVTELTATGTMDGWTMKAPGNANPIPIKVLAIGGDSVVTESATYNSILRKGQKVSIHAIQRLKDGKLNGVVHAKWANGDTATLRVEGTRKGAAQ